MCDQWQVLLGQCHPLLEQGPCDPGQWLVYPGQCELRPCAGDSVWWPELCECVSDVTRVCGEGETLEWTPYGEGQCVDQDEAVDLDLSYEDWISGFAARGSGHCTRVSPCEGDTIPWSDGQCYQLASTGPCPSGQWLVLENIVDDEPVVTCQDRKCGAEHVWWSENCTCVSLDNDNDVKLKSGLGSPCADNELLMVSPYGDAVCGVIDDDLDLRLFERIPDNYANRQNCQVLL